MIFGFASRISLTSFICCSVESARQIVRMTASAFRQSFLVRAEPVRAEYTCAAPISTSADAMVINRKSMTLSARLCRRSLFSIRKNIVSAPYPVAVSFVERVHYNTEAIKKSLKDIKFFVRRKRAMHGVHGNGSHGSVNAGCGQSRSICRSSCLRFSRNSFVIR